MWNSARLCLALSILTFAATTAAQSTQPGPITRIHAGRLEGAWLAGGGAVFRGIPYALPPVGELRWREPQPVRPWKGVRAATQAAPNCAQLPALLPDALQATKEDCLYLSVWTPEWPSRSHKPVMVWIPGGGNYAGGTTFGTFEGQSLARHGVVVVTLNYRLGVFGFFSHPELTRESPHHTSGNQGLLDQIAALQWVQDNIGSFGGDPDNVTVFGESAGSIDISVLMTSPLSHGLFRRAIGESGTVLMVVQPKFMGNVLGIGNPPPLAQAEQHGQQWARHWGLPANASLQQLRALSAVDILKTEPNYAAHPPQDLFISLDGYVLPRKPAEVFARGQEQPVALLLGNNSRERPPGFDVPVDLKEALGETYGPLSERAWALYGVAPTDASYGSPGDQWADDVSFRCAAVAQLLWHVAAGRRAYEFEFARAPQGRESVGAVHGSDFAYVFGTLDQGIFPPNLPAVVTDIDRRVSDVMEEYWTNFAKSGDPNDGQLPTWRAFDASSRAYLQFTADGPVAKQSLRRPYCDLFVKNIQRLEQP